MFVACGAQVGDEGDVRHGGGRRLVGEDELGPAPPAAERLALVLGSFVRVVAAEGAVADEKRADPGEQVVDGGVGWLSGVGGVIAGPSFCLVWGVH